MISSVICSSFIGVSYGEIKKLVKILGHAPFRRAYHIYENLDLDDGGVSLRSTDYTLHTEHAYCLSYRFLNNVVLTRKMVPITRRASSVLESI